MPRCRLWSISLVGSLLGAGLAAVACSEGGSSAAGAIRLAVIPKGTLHEFWKAVHAGAKTAAVELGVAIEWKGPDPEGDRQAQIQTVQNFLSAGVQGIVLAPVDQQALVPAVAEAKAAKVPTVVFDSGLGGDAHVAFVATDNRAGGVLAAERLGSLLHGKGRVVMLRFQQGSASTMAREEGFLSTLQAKFPQIQVVSSDQYGGDTEKAVAASESLLVAHPDVDGAFCPNESTAHGMLIALQRGGKAGKVKFVGFDASSALVTGLEKNEIHGLVVQDPVGMGKRAVELMVLHLRGQSVPKDVATDLVLATPENRTEPKVQALLKPDLSILSR